MPPPRGRFITLEGGEGVGKSTQLAHLTRHLKARGVEIVATREPGGTPKAEKLRDALLAGRVAPLGPLAEAAAFCAARIDHVDKLIAPALSRGAWVLCDRYTDSTRAYQGARGGVEGATLALLERASVGEIRPDLTIILDLPASEGLARAQARGGIDRFEAENLAFHEGLRRAFLDIAANEPQRCQVINADRPLEEVLKDIRNLVDHRFFTPALGASQ